MVSGEDSMTVICSKCKKECSDYEFKGIGNDILPVCTDCTGRKKVMEALASVEKERFERNMYGDIPLTRWIK